MIDAPQHFKLFMQNQAKVSQGISELQCVIQAIKQLRRQAGTRWNQMEIIICASVMELDTGTYICEVCSTTELLRY